MTEDSIDDPFPPGVVIEAAHWSCPPAHLAEAAFDRVGGAYFLVVLPRAAEEAQEFLQVTFKASHSLRGFAPPAVDPIPVGTDSIEPGGTPELPQLPWGAPQDRKSTRLNS